jgi:hypothetical protein
MSADPMMGIDPESQEPMEMPQDGQLPPELMEMMGQEGPGVDPQAGPADPMLQQEPPEAYGPAAPGEYETRERVELCVLLAIETLAKATEAGDGAANMEYAMKAGQAAASWGQVYTALTQAEQKEAASSQPPAPSFPS